MKRLLIGLVIGILTGLVLGILLALSTTAFGAQAIRLLVDGKEIIFPEAPPQMINDRVMVPARPLAEALGAKVEWDEAGQAVVVISPSKAKEIPQGYVDLNTLAKYGCQVGQVSLGSKYSMMISKNGHSVEIPQSGDREIQAVSDNGTIIHALSINARLYVQEEDLKTAGIIP